MVRKCVKLYCILYRSVLFIYGFRINNLVILLLPIPWDTGKEYCKYKRWGFKHWYLRNQFYRLDALNAIDWPIRGQENNVRNYSVSQKMSPPLNWFQQGGDIFLGHRVLISYLISYTDNTLWTQETRYGRNMQLVLLQYTWYQDPGLR